MTKREAKKIALLKAAGIIRSAPECWECFDDISKEDEKKVMAAWDEIVDELFRRAGYVNHT